jgi:hypothetical protein
MRLVISTKSTCQAHAVVVRVVPAPASPSPRCTHGTCTRYAIGGKGVCTQHTSLPAACKHPGCPIPAGVNKVMCEIHDKKVRSTRRAVAREKDGNRGRGAWTD